MLYKLNGNSKADVYLIRNEVVDQYKVRKISSNFNFNERLMSQYKKHLVFSDNGYNCPKILDADHVGQLFYYDMEYINGSSLSDYIINGGNISNQILIQISKFLNSMVKNDENFFYEKHHFINKINQIDLNVNVKYKSHYYLNILNYLLNYSWPLVTKGFAHGDFTLDNIIIKDERIFYIDFDSVSHDSAFMDIVKMMQDTRSKWCYRNNKSIEINNLTPQLQTLDNILVDLLKNNYHELIPHINAILCLHLFRIVPYSKNEKDNNFLISSINKLISA